MRQEILDDIAKLGDALDVSTIPKYKRTVIGPEYFYEYRDTLRKEKKVEEIANERIS